MTINNVVTEIMGNAEGSIVPSSTTPVLQEVVAVVVHTHRLHWTVMSPAGFHVRLQFVSKTMKTEIFLVPLRN